MLGTTRSNQIIAIISNPLSTFLSTEILSLRSSPTELKITLLQQHQDSRSGLPFVAMSPKSHCVSVGAAHLCAPRFLQACVREGVKVWFFWKLTENSDEEIKDALQSFPAVKIYTERQVYPTDTDIVFQALTDVPDLIGFVWYFGDSQPIRTTTQNITERFRMPNRYSVGVVATNGLSSFTSEVLHLVVQRVVKPNKLVHQASVVLNQTVAFLCRVSAGNNLSYIWNFGEGNSRIGGHSEQHVFHRTGEFTVEVTVSNLVSSASLNGQIFVVASPCQPPPVKNMGPHVIQVMRSDTVRLGVTYEGEVQCDISQGVKYTWSLYDSSGQAVQLPPADTHRQSVALPGHFLGYDTYTAIARVQIVGVVVYSNYTVCVKVNPTPPLAIIDGGTNVFLNNRNNTVISLNGRYSYDPDSLTNTLGYSWSCEPISSIVSSCFDHYMLTSASTIKFPAGFLKRQFDQFKFKLTVGSETRSAFSESFITVTPTLLRKVSVYCSQCQGDKVNWEQMFSVRAACEDCVPKNIVFSWSLYLVNGSSKVVTDVPFCHTVDLSTPVTINEGPEDLSVPTHRATQTQTAHPPVTALIQPSQDFSIAESQTETYPAEKRLKSTTIKNLNLTGGAEFQNAISLNKANRIPASSKSTFETVQLDSQPSPTLSSTQATSWSEFDPQEPPTPFYEFSPIALDDSRNFSSATFGQKDSIAEFYTDSDQSTVIDFPSLESGSMGGQPDLEANGTSFPVSNNQTETPVFSDSDYDDPFLGVEEGDPGASVGRPACEDDESSSLRGVSYPAGPVEGEEEGSNLVDLSPSLVIQKPSILDLPRQLIDKSVLESYTFTGISGPRITFKPYSLKADSRYMLEVTANSNDVLFGKTQLFLVTNPIAKGMTCQVQPSSGLEIHTQFSVFCASGKEDLWYEYSYNTGKTPRKVFYHGRDFQHFFNLPSGLPNDDYKVIIYIKVWNGFGSATKPCPVTVRVQPSFLRKTSSSYDPDLELFDSGLRNLSALVHLGNMVEISNYVTLLISVLNRLSLDLFAKTHTQTQTRGVLIFTLCHLDITNQESMIDNIGMLQDLTHITQQVTLVSARQVTSHTQSISERFHDPDVPALYDLDQWTVDTLVNVLSHSLLAAAHAVELVPGPSNPDEITQTAPVAAQGVEQLVRDILQTTADLPLKYILLNQVKHHNITAKAMAVQTTRHDTVLAPVIGSRQTTFYLPDFLDQRLFAPGHRDPRNSSKHCVLSQLTEFTQNPYLWSNIPGQQHGPVVDLSFYNCSTRKVIPLRFLSQPVNVEFIRTPRNKSSVTMHTLTCDQINYHSFNITRELVKRAIQLSLVFTCPPNKAFPITLLFRMFKRPTPSLYHLHKIHMFEGNAKYMHITLPPNYLPVGGIGYLALMNADYRTPPSYRYLSSQVNYSVTVEATQCLSWDGQDSWTHLGCLPQMDRSTTTVNCSCHHFRSLTMVQQQLQTDYDSADLAKLVSLFRDLTLVGTLVVVVCLYALVMVVCQRADVHSESSLGAHCLLDNSPSDTHLYAVTIQTGLHSASNMTAKVYIVLYGDEGASQTRELQAPNLSLFKRNSRHTFTISTAESLGSLWGVHLWHDNSGSSPSWYLKQVEVCKVVQGTVEQPCCLFLGLCWLAFDKGDGQVERRLRVCTQGIGFTKMLRLKLSGYMADSHLWVSVYTHLYTGVFTHTQRLSVCLLLLLGYACGNALQISQLDDLYTFELGLIDVSAISLTLGLFSVLAMVPVATGVSFLFRLHQVTPKRSEASKNQRQPRPYFNSAGASALSINNSVLESQLSRRNQGEQAVWKKKFELPGLVSMSHRDLVNKEIVDQIQQGNARYLFTRGSRDLGNQSDLAKTGNDLELIIDQEENKDVTRGKKDLLSWETSLCAQKAEVIQQKEFEDWLANENSSQGTLQQCNTVTDDTNVHQDSDVFVHHVNNHNRCGLLGAIVKCFPCWCNILAWALCLLLSLTFLVFAALLGTRFNSSQILLWFHSLFFSLIICIFLVQPAMILMVAVVVSFWYRKSSDFDSCFGITRFMLEALKLVGQDGTDQPVQLQHSTPHKPQQERCSYFEKVLAARQRARYLRLVRPPTQAQLRRGGGRRRKDTLIQTTLGDLAYYGSMLFLLLCISYGRQSTDQYHLNKAVRNQFSSSGAHNLFQSIQTHNEWWDWARTNLLDGLYWNGNLSATGKASAIQGTCQLLGEPILKRIEASKSSHCQLPSELADLVPGCLRDVTSEEKASDTVPIDGSRSRVGLGFTRSESLSRLEYLRSDGWLDRGVAAVHVQFTLYNPATNLFTSVGLHVERTPGGTLLPSVDVFSARVYHSPTAWDYGIMVCQLLFLLLSLLHIYGQMSSVGQNGLPGNRRTHCNWLEVSILLISLVCYVCYVYHSILTLEVIDMLQRHDYKEYVDVSLLSVCEQHTSALRGVLLFLLVVKCVFVLSVNRTMAVPVTLLKLTLSGLLWPMVSGVVLLMALFCIENLLLGQASLVFSSLPHSLLIVLSYCRGPAGLRSLSLSRLYHNGVSNSDLEVFSHGAICLCATLVWTALVIAVVSSLVKYAKRNSRRTSLLSLASIAVYIRERASALVGKYRPKWTDSQLLPPNYYLEEFESLMDELLFKLNLLPCNLPLPLKASKYTVENLNIFGTHSLSILGSQQSVSSSTVHFTRAMMLNDLAHLTPTDLEHRPSSDKLSSQLKLESPLTLQNERKCRDNPNGTLFSKPAIPTNFLQAEPGSGVNGSSLQMFTRNDYRRFFPISTKQLPLASSQRQNLLGSSEDQLTQCVVQGNETCTCLIDKKAHMKGRQPGIEKGCRCFNIEVVNVEVHEQPNCTVSRAARLEQGELD